MEKNSLRYENNVSIMLDKAVILFKKTGLNELADKWDKILKNYRHSKPKY